MLIVYSFTLGSSRPLTSEPIETSSADFFLPELVISEAELWLETLPLWECFGVLSPVALDAWSDSGDISIGLGPVSVGVAINTKDR